MSGAIGSTSSWVRLPLTSVEAIVGDIMADFFGVDRQRITSDTSMSEDLGGDSLDVIELILELEEKFELCIPDNPTDPVLKAIWSRRGMRVGDIAEYVYILQGSGRKPRPILEFVRNMTGFAAPTIPFSQLGGRAVPASLQRTGALERLEKGWYRRRSDGMRCVLVPMANVEIGNPSADIATDEQPHHWVPLDEFIIDAEPVSTTAYCRFLNSLDPAPTPEMLRDWFVLADDDRRGEHMPIKKKHESWDPIYGTECWPMILVSWYGANAYSLWANGRPWHEYRDENGDARGSYLPTEAQWEYAARGATYRTYPWGESEPSEDRLVCGRLERGKAYQLLDLPCAAVNASVGMSPFGLHHMAGNVWQWCRDWYAPSYYDTPAAKRRDAWNNTPSGTRAERGGSWIGSAELCRSSYRRGRPALARGRCLGFRCISELR